MMTDKAPRGVTRMAGANVYAAKFATIDRKGFFYISSHVHVF